MKMNMKMVFTKQEVNGILKQVYVNDFISLLQSNILFPNFCYFAINTRFKVPLNKPLYIPVKM